MKLHPYLNYGGNCAEAFRFYEKHLGGKINFMMTFAQMPDPKQIPPGLENGVLHVSMHLGETVIMASDVQSERFQPIRSAYLSLSVDSDDEAERIYKLLEEGGEVFMPIQETFFATRFASLRDKFGTSWMIVHNRPMPA
ncbi:VOC family protein [Terracidiphilus sp.]|jgi:PhnB protein|uniref:VOC family protein n=1 Tax=Terracidiphilus sp. TaxID=1964191 RepID=UPI003C23A765